MKNIKKFLAVPTAAAMLMACLTGCGGGGSTTLRLEAEDADLSNCQAQEDPYEYERYLLTDEGDEYAKSIFGAEASGEGLVNYSGITRDQVESWVADLVLSDDSCSNGQYLRQWGEVGGNTVVFTFESKKDTTGTITFSMASDEYNWNSLETSDKENLDQAIYISVNGTLLDLSGIVLTGSFDDVTETAFQDVVFEDVSIVKGTNTIELTVMSYEEEYSYDTYDTGEIVTVTETREVTNGAPNIDYVEITADATLS